MVKKEIIDYFKFPQEKIYVIYNAVDLKKFNSEKNLDKRKILRDKLGLSHNQSAFLFVGSGFERKGLSVLLDCMVYLHKDCFLMVIGKDKELEKYIKKTKRLGISERVFFLGMQKDIAPFYAAADAFVLPTLYDAFANTVLEAMAASLPVITSYKCGAVDLIENGNNGFVCDSLDKTKIIEYMKILRDPVTRQTIGKNGRDTVKNFTVENMSNSLYSLYEKILA
jgi:UDP-glucose:(heptosyl)LPS alpha-1,3-glucosyltransferase